MNGNCKAGTFTCCEFLICLATKRKKAQEACKSAGPVLGRLLKWLRKWLSEVASKHLKLIQGNISGEQNDSSSIAADDVDVKDGCVL